VKQAETFSNSSQVVIVCVKQVVTFVVTLKQEIMTYSGLKVMLRAPVVSSVC